MEGGFSLIELMVVVVLIGILSAMVLPAMRGTFEDALLRSTARKLVDGLNLASSHAVTINQIHQLRLDAKHTHYYVERSVHDPQQGKRFIALRDLSGAEGEIDSRIVVEVRKLDEEPRDPSDSWETRSNPDALTFQPDGTAEGAEIVLRDRDGFRLALRINPTTARVHIVELGRQ